MYFTNIIKKTVKIITSNRYVIALINPLFKESLGARNFLSYKYILGQGIEIGALHNPLPVSKNVSVTYIDRMSVNSLRQHYPELKNQKLVNVDIMSNGELLDGVKDMSQDFVISIHLIEHVENPLGAIENWLRVLKPGGIIYLAVPNKDNSFDKHRDITSNSHILKDYEIGFEQSRKQHYKEWAVKVEGAMEEAINEKVESLMQMEYSIHFHVWDLNAFLGFMIFCQKDRLFPFKIESCFSMKKEFIFILRKF